MIAPTGFFADYGCHVRIQGHAQALQACGHQVRIVTYPGGREAPGLTIVRPPWPPGARGRDMPATILAGAKQIGAQATDGTVAA